MSDSEIRSRLKDFGKTSDLYNIPINDIEIDPDFNLRLDSPELAAHIEWLRGQILEFGYLRHEPLIVRLTRDKRVILVDGHCRLAAVKLARMDGAEIETLPCLSEGKGISPVDRTVLMFSVNGGLNFSPLEQAIGVKRLLGWNLSEAEIGKRIGKTRQHVANLLELAAAPPEVQVMVVDGTLAATEAVKTIRAHGDNAPAVLKAAQAHAQAAGKPKVTHKNIAAVRPPPAPVQLPPRRFEPVKVPLSVTAAHVVLMAEGIELPADLRRAIDALAESLS